MKKLKFVLYLLLISICLTIPSMVVEAQSSKEVFYPSEITDYVDLNNVNHFAVHDSKIFYVKNDNSVICYDKSTKTSTTLNSTGSVFNLVVEGDYLFIFANGNYPYVYNVNDLTSKTFQTFTKAYNKAVNVNYVNNKYYFAFVDNTSLTFNVWTFNYNLTLENKYTYGSNFSNSSAYISLSDDLIIYKPVAGDKIYLFNYPTTELIPITSGSDNPYFRIDGFSDSTTTNSIAVVNLTESSYSNCIFIACEDATSTKVCKFNGSSLTYNSDNNLICDKIYASDNNLYVYNLSNADIITYEYNSTNDTFTLKEMILAGKGSEKGRFKDVTNINYKGGVMYVTDSGNNRIQIVSESNTRTEGNYGTNDKITEVVSDSHNNFYYTVYDGLHSRLYKNGEFQSSSTKEIISIDIGLDDSIYALTSDGYIIQYTNGNASSPVKLGKAIKSNSKLRINHNFLNLKHPISSIVAESRINISVDNVIYRFNSTGTYEKTLTFSSNIVDFKINGAVATTPVYALLENGNFIKSSFNESEDKNITLTGFSNYSAFSMDIVSGKFQMYNKNLSAIEIYLNDEFSTTCTLSSYLPDAYNSSGFNQVWNYAQVKSNAFIYDYYYFIGNYYHVGEITNVIVLNANEEFAYVGYTLNNKLTFGYVEISDLVDGIKPMAISDTTYKLRTTNKNVSVFKYPSIYNDMYFYSFAQGDVITTYGRYVSSIDNNEYYVVKIGNNYGYVCSNDVVLNENISKNIKTNAIVKIFDGSKKVNVYLTAEEGSSVICQLPDGYKINAIDYNKNSTYTKITFIDEDQQEREGYILTSYVKLNGLSTAVITAIILLVVDIIIAIIVIAFFRHYKKKQKENNKK